MKWFAGPDYRIWVSSLERQHTDAEGDEPPLSFGRYFKDMYQVWIMDSSLRIVFLSAVCRPGPSLEAGDDMNVTNVRRAGAVALFDARILVIPDGSRSGKSELIARPHQPSSFLPPEVPVFYVTPECYESYLDELDLLARQPVVRPSVEAREDEWLSYTSQYPLGPLHSTIAHLPVIQFIDTKVLSSPYLTDEERRWIGR